MDAYTQVITIIIRYHEVSNASSVRINAALTSNSYSPRRNLSAHWHCR